jgi:hypothetical protein
MPAVVVFAKDDLAIAACDRIAENVSVTAALEEGHGCAQIGNLAPARVVAEHLGYSRPAGSKHSAVKGGCHAINGRQHGLAKRGAESALLVEGKKLAIVIRRKE